MIDTPRPAVGEFVSEPIDPGRHRLDISSGEPSLDTWLCDHAVNARRVARTFVWVSAAEPDTVCGYYSLAAHVITRDHMTRSLAHGAPRETPAVLLARLALDRRWQGSGLGGALLADALRRAVLATYTVAARFVVVDALHESAAAFYEHYGFRRVPGAMRLVQKVSDVAAALDL